MLKNTLSLVTICSLLFWSCNSEKEGDLVVDCTVSDLEVMDTEVVKPGCVTKGSVTVAATGGEAAYEYSMGGGQFQSSGTFNEISAGAYEITVRDATGCTAKVSVNVEAADSGIEGTVVSTEGTTCGGTSGSVTLSATGGDGSYTYSVDGGDFTTTETIVDLTQGAHVFTVKDGTGCTDDGEFRIFSSISLQGDIMPIITNKCATSSSCHDTGASGKPVLVSKAEVIAKAERIKFRTGNKSMPLTGSLTDEQIEMIACWVDDGAPDN